MPLKTLFLNPPSFENFDGGAGSRWPATREIESYWYPVWLAYPAGQLEGSRLLDAPSHHISRDRDHRDREEVRISGAVYQHPGLSRRYPAGAKIKEHESADQDCVRRSARQRAAGEGAPRMPGDRFRVPQGIRLLGGRICQRQTAERDSGHLVI